tara:strand:+ start:273 stop:653 length:381 start_codon:yes stop_codon:yes gene_type:complete
MEEIFLKISVNNSNDLALKFLIVPFTLLVYYFLLLFFSRRKLSKSLNIDNFLINHQFSKIYSSIFCVFLLNIYWYFLLRLNGINKLDWSFSYDLTNIYLQLLPFIFTNIVLIYIYIKSKEKINNLI